MAVVGLEAVASQTQTTTSRRPPRPPWNYPAPWWNLRGPLSYPSLRLLRGAGSGGDSKQRGGQGATPGPGSGTGDPSRSASDLLDIAIAPSGIHIRHVVSPLRTRALLARLRSSSIASERQITGGSPGVIELLSFASYASDFFIHATTTRPSVRPSGRSEHARRPLSSPSPLRDANHFQLHPCSCNTTRRHGKG